MGAKFHLLLTILTRFGGAGLAACSAILLAHVLGPAGIGLFALLRALPAVLLMLTELGIAAASPYLINNRKHAASDVLGNAMLAGAVIGLVQILIWVASYQLIGEYILRGLPTFWVLAAALIAPIDVQTTQLRSIFRSLQDFWTANLMRIGLEASLLASLGIAAALDMLEISSLVPCLLLAFVPVALLAVGRLVTLRLAPTLKLNPTLLAESIRFGIPAQFSTAVQYLNYRLDHLILGIITAPEVVGVYFVATRAAEIFAFFPTCVEFVLAPRLAQRSLLAALRTVQRYAPLIFLLNLAVMAAAAVIGPYLFPLLFDDWSREAILPFWILLAGLAAMGANGTFFAFNIAQGMPEQNAYPSVLGLAITIALDLALIPSYGQVGAALASSIAYAATAVMLAMLFWRVVRTGTPSFSRHA